MFKGSFVALVSPLKGGKFSEDEFQSLVEWHVREGTHGLVPMGTTGESPTFSFDEHARVVDLALEASGRKIPVIAGAGANSTDKAIELAKYAHKRKADGILVVTPYYNKPTQEGLFQHYKAIHDAVDIPLILYNVPGRTAVDLSVETVVRLSKLPRITGIKDAHVDLSRPLAMRTQITRDDFCFLSGEDATVAAYLAQGGHGCISVTANVAPKACAELHTAWMTKDMARFNTLRDWLMPLHTAMFVETNPAPAKYALSLMGKCSPEVRLPLVSVSDVSRKKIEDVLKLLNLMPAKDHDEKRARG